MSDLTLRAKLALNDSEFGAKLDRAVIKAKAAGGEMAKGLGSAAAGALSALGVGLSAAFAGRALVQGVSNVYEAGAALHRLQAETGGSLSGLAQLDTAFQMAGVSSESMGGALNRMQRSLLTGGDAFKELRLNIRDLAVMTPDKQFIAVGHAIENLTDSAQRAQIVRKIFGRSGDELLAVFDSSAFKDAGGVLTGRSKVLAENAENFYQVSQALTRAGLNFKNFFIGVAGGLGKSLIPLLAKIEAADLVGIGKTFGEGLAYGASELASALSQIKESDLKSLGSDLAWGAKQLAEVIPGLVDAAKELSQAAKDIVETSPNAGKRLLNNLSQKDRDQLSGGDYLTFDPHHDGRPWQSKVLALQAATQDQNRVTVSGRTSMFATDGMKFQSPGMQFKGDGFLWGSNGAVYHDQTRGGALDAPSGGTYARDATVTSGLQTGGLLTGTDWDKQHAQNRMNAQKIKDATQGQTVHAPGVEKKLDQLHQDLQ